MQYDNVSDRGVSIACNRLLALFYLDTSATFLIDGGSRYEKIISSSSGVPDTLLTLDNLLKLLVSLLTLELSTDIIEASVSLF